MTTIVTTQPPSCYFIIAARKKALPLLGLIIKLKHFLHSHDALRACNGACQKCPDSLAQPFRRVRHHLSGHISVQKKQAVNSKDIIFQRLDYWS
ncbi:hypothetical protein AUEXF2481DRAFT_44895 [Aureobasidium subglaciale EXF-2481]|uniref:Uncharacterized protein n=1 Tax=Aureobasidium subglaciale (strain EXF-2481) TaxID=1043005 RepID=A0A074XZ38_AURSE|nr:uncharacterized protein AUEXF2481DRAFT_44895 [Aureobasidium subglaciale EXF-2481]KEQ90700.1 hypothetical protein AUEXF2481DRAFT_44895 [Aureobasidium subglaciale EXF-2481]